MIMKQQHITVFGSFVVDLMSRAPHLPVPGETVKGSMFRIGPGGKGFNQGVAAKKAGADVTMVTKIRRDTFGNIALNTMKELNMDASHVFLSEKSETGAALIMVDENTSQNAIMVTLGACSEITEEDVDSIEETVKNSGYLLTQLETNVDAVERVVDMAHRYGVTVVLNTAPVQPISDELLKKVDIITPNEVEAEILTGIKVDNEGNAQKAAEYFFGKGIKTVVITLGKRGVFVSTAQKHGILPVPKVDVLDTTGAGDAFNGALVASLAEGKDIWEACVFANAAASISVTRLGTTPAMPVRSEIDRFLSEHK